MVTFMPEHSILPIGMGDGLLLALIALHFVWALDVGTAALRTRTVDRHHLGRVAEALFFFAGFLFIFAYVYASNANMDYVQRFVAGGGTIQLAPDTRTERLLVSGRYGPFLVVDLALWLLNRRRERIVAPALMLASVALSVLAYPSFVDVEGYGALGWISMVPLFVLMRREVAAGRSVRAIWYGVLYGVLFTLIGNYWLGTFNLISLQAVGVIFLVFYLLYMPVAVGALRIVGGLRDTTRSGVNAEPVRVGGDGIGSSAGARFREVAVALVLPLSWSAFELARSSGFLGYPWLLMAHSQYRFPTLIQSARFGGVWLVGFVVLLVNALIAEGAIAVIERRGRSVATSINRAFPWLLAALLVFGINTVFGWTVLRRDAPIRDTVRLALIQQNSDPRKHDYQRTFESLTRLTDASLAADPDMVVWSETAFVPNIRRWSQENPRRYRLAALVRDLLGYLETVDTWLLTGNDDYRRILDEDGEEVRRDNYNAAVLFSDDDVRQDTYHKVKLVPFTEHFPYREQLPWVYDLLMSVDITFWTPGEEYTIFEHPRFRFATPICFEDVFPAVVRRFALEGMEVIVNITNDYWSLREQAAQQHFAAALFRTVELSMPMVRATASGVTSHIDYRGRIVATVPQYSEQFLIADVAIPDRRGGTFRPTAYHRWGDWFPVAALGVLGLIVIGAIVRRVRRNVAMKHTQEQRNG